MWGVRESQMRRIGKRGKERLGFFIDPGERYARKRGRYYRKRKVFYGKREYETIRSAPVERGPGRRFNADHCRSLLRHGPGDLGAEVIKVEQPKIGDESRAWGPPWVKEISAYFISINRNKKSLTLNSNIPKGSRSSKAGPELRCTFGELPAPAPWMNWESD